MGGVWTDWVWEHSGVKGADLLVLLAIAWFENKDGRGAWPSVATLAKRTRLTERQVRYSLRDLEKAGILKVTPNAGPHGSNLYHVLTPEVASGGTEFRGKSDTATPERSSATPEPTSATPEARSPKPIGTRMEFNKNPVGANGNSSRRNGNSKTGSEFAGLSVDASSM